VTDTRFPGCDFAYANTDRGWNVATTSGEMASLCYATY
jgi:hypothetical protein